VDFLQPPALDFTLDIAHRYIQSPVNVVKYLKEQLVCVFATQAGCADECEFVQPLGPLGKGVLAGGWVKHQLKRIMRVRSEYNLLRAYDVLMSKNLMPKVPTEFEHATMVKHAKTLGVRHDYHADPLIREQVHRKIDEICDHVFGDVKNRQRELDPSVNACYGGSRKEGGAYGLLSKSSAWSVFTGLPLLRPDLVTAERLEEAAENFADMHQADIISDNMCWIPHIHTSQCRSALRGHVTVVGESAYASFQEEIDKEILRRLENSNYRPPAEPVSIFEPLKVRVITKGDPYLYYRALELQKMMHHALRQSRPFEYAGQPIDDDDWDLRFRNLKIGEFYVSGDYSAATDNLDPELSEYTWTAIALRMSIPVDGIRKRIIDTIYYRIGMLCLTGHQLIYETKGWTKEEIAEILTLCPDATIKHLVDSKGDERECLVIPQQWGQLMGSPMSFPILCLVNAAVSAVALDIETPDLFKTDCSFAVNGDDISFIANPASYERWGQITKMFGLEKSPGKNYTSPDWVIMNSELRMARRHADGWVQRWQHRGFVNLTLLCGVERKGVEAGADLRRHMGWWQLGPRARGLIRGINPEQSKRLMTAFIYYHHALLEECPPGISWNTSEELGGAGLPSLGETIPSGNLINSAVLATLTNKERQKVLRFPKFEAMSELEFDAAKAEEFYSAQMGTVEIPCHGLLPDHELLPFERKSVLARPAVMGYVHRLAIASTFELLVKDPTKCDGLVGPHIGLATNSSYRRYWKEFYPKPKADGPERTFRLRVRRFSQNLGRFLGKHQTSNLHPMEQSRAESWTPDTETVVDWDRIPFTKPTRFRNDKLRWDPAVAEELPHVLDDCLAPKGEVGDVTDDVDIDVVTIIPETEHHMVLPAMVFGSVPPVLRQTSWEKPIADLYWPPDERERLIPLGET